MTASPSRHLQKRKSAPRARTPRATPPPNANRSATSGAISTYGTVITRRQQTVERIIEGTINALCEQGFGGLTTRKIAASASVPLATLHYHFKNKDTLLLAVLDTLTSRVATTLRNNVKPSRNLTECIDNVLDAGWRAVIENRPLQLVQYELTLYALRTRGVEWLAKRQYLDYIRAHEVIFAAHAPSTPAVRAFINQLARFVMAGIDGVILQELVDSSDARSRAAIGMLAEAAKDLVASRRKVLTVPRT
jgi:AcrR family transcriptional regulator